MPRKKAKEIYKGVERHKSSVARVSMIPGTGVITVGNKILDEYIPQEILRMVVKSPLIVMEL